MHEQLELVLAREVAGFKSLLSCKQLTAGASQETFRIQLETDDGERLLALRRCPPTLAGKSVPGQLALSTEAHLLRLAASAEIPVPELVYLLQAEDCLGDGYLMEWLEGETLGQRIVRSEAYAAVRPRLARQCGEALARIHAIEVDEQLTALLPTISPEALINDTWDIYKALNVPEPMIDFSARWLLDNLPANTRNALVHGDFRNGNLMIDENGIRAVLDWELTQIGDPVRDLGWLCVNSWRFGQTDLTVGGFGTIEDLLEGYHAVSGEEISRADLTFWQVFGSFWWSITTLAMAATWRSGETPSLERPVIGRRSSEGQMDCVNLLCPGEFDLPGKMMTDHGDQLPMPAELLEGVRKFLREDVAENQTGRTAFLAKVAANSLGIAQRELLHGQALALSEHKRLETLLGDGELGALRWELVNKLREKLPLETPGLAEHLRQTVAGQLAIDQPHYSAFNALT
ncbi:phosphotransferase family protein [Halioglobus maricola]|uniref:Phosphotransferase family protein n=1 Tax=Halioglobus maricola TaxID=2601894 RepID=A0A5P9NHK8_9GAMM|nr:phosphotransferase family protein [Halioglobus maricola]QFU75272.1 phosphotransferase family protein [Halioglobus maricola]